MMRAVVFDAYGTLLDVHAAMARHAARLPPDWERISAEWRLKQLEYSWVSTLTGPAGYRDFRALTQAALEYVAARHGIGDPSLLRALLESYEALPAYEDAKPALAGLRGRGIGTAILSNGTPAMLDAAVRAAGIEGLLDAVLSVDSIGMYKPSPPVYRLAAARFGLDPGEMGFVSSNAWDAQGAVQAGFRVFWCNRSGQPAEYGLDRDATVLGGLAELEAALA